MKYIYYLIIITTIMSCDQSLSKRAVEFTHDEKIQYGGHSYLRSGVKEPETVFGLVINGYPYEKLPKNLNFLSNIQGFEIYDSYHLDWAHTETVINSLDKIEYLRFNNSTFSRLPFVPDSLSSLRKVYLYGLKNLDVTGAVKQLSELKNLEVLGLYDLSYEQIPLEISDCSQLKAIYLGSNTPIDYQQHFSVFEKMSGLETLWIDDANITELPENFIKLDLSEVRFSYCTSLDYESALNQVANFKNLHTLRIKGTYLSSIPHALRELDQLKNLYLIDNRKLDLNSLSEDLAYLPNLEILDLSSSDPNPNKKPDKPRYIPEGIRNLKNLKVLRIDDFRYQDINQIGSVCRDLPNLEELSIPYMSEYQTRNRLVSLPANFFSSGFEKIKSLNVSQNRNGIFDNFEVLPSSITHLYLNEIYYEEFPKIVYSLPGLLSLELRENELTSLPKDIIELENLIHLDLGKNQLEDLPDEIAQLKNLRFLHLDENPLVDDKGKVMRIKALLPNTVISFYE